jgi:hypothetical protein
MGEAQVFEIPGIFSCYWDADTKAIIGRWQSFRTDRVAEIVTRHIAEGGTRGARTCVIDVSQIKGVLSPEDSAWVEKSSPALLSKAKIAAIVNIIPASALTKMGADRWAKAALGNGVNAYTCSSPADAAQIARDVLAGRAA